MNTGSRTDSHVDSPLQRDANSATVNTVERRAPQDVLALLQLEPIDKRVFRNRYNEDNQSNTLFGGQLLAQAAAAAAMTVDMDSHWLHSLHGYFLRRGSPLRSVTFRVQITLDGGSFCNRRVIAEQDGRQLFELMASFHRQQAGFEHQCDYCDDVPPPESLTSLKDLMREHADRLEPYVVQRFSNIATVEIRPCDVDNYLFRKAHQARGRYWLKIVQRLPDSPLIHQLALAYASDYWLLGAAIMQHSASVLSERIIASSLDHAMWFHRPVRADQWFLHVTDSPSASGGRGLARGLISDRQGCLLATTCQEAVIRPARGDDCSDDSSADGSAGNGVDNGVEDSVSTKQ